MSLQALFDASSIHTVTVPQDLFTSTRSSCNLPCGHNVRRRVFHARAMILQSSNNCSVWYHFVVYSPLFAVHSLTRALQVHVHCFREFARSQGWTRCPLCRKTAMTPHVRQLMIAHIDAEIARCFPAPARARLFSASLLRDFWRQSAAVA